MESSFVQVLFRRKASLRLAAPIGSWESRQVDLDARIASGCARSFHARLQHPRHFPLFSFSLFFFFFSFLFFASLMTLITTNDKRRRERERERRKSISNQATFNCVGSIGSLYADGATPESRNLIIASKRRREGGCWLPPTPSLILLHKTTNTEGERRSSGGASPAHNRP